MGGDWKEMFLGVETNDFDLVRYHISRTKKPSGFLINTSTQTHLLFSKRIGHSS
jgi:hypothetical protein